MLLESETDTEEEVAGFAVNLLYKVAEAVLVADFQREELPSGNNSALPTEVYGVGIRHVIVCYHEA